MKNKYMYFNKNLKIKINFKNCQKKNPGFNAKRNSTSDSVLSDLMTLVKSFNPPCLQNEGAG